MDRLSLESRTPLWASPPALGVPAPLLPARLSTLGSGEHRALGPGLSPHPARP